MSLSPSENHGASAPYPVSSPETVQVSPARPHPRSVSEAPDSVYMQESRSGHICRLCSRMSSAVFTIAVTVSAAAIGAGPMAGQPRWALTPSRNRAPPTPPARTAILTSSDPARAVRGDSPALPEPEQPTAQSGQQLAAADQPIDPVRRVEQGVGQGPERPQHGEEDERRPRLDRPHPLHHSRRQVWRQDAPAV